MSRDESAAARDSECRFTPAWQPGADANLQRAGKQPSAATWSRRDLFFVRLRAWWDGIVLFNHWRWPRV